MVEQSREKEKMPGTTTSYSMTAEAYTLDKIYNQFKWGSIPIPVYWLVCSTMVKIGQLERTAGRDHAEVYMYGSKQHIRSLNQICMDINGYTMDVAFTKRLYFNNHCCFDLMHVENLKRKDDPETDNERIKTLESTIETLKDQLVIMTLKAQDFEMSSKENVTRLTNPPIILTS